MLSMTLKVLVPIILFHLFGFPAVNIFCLNEVHYLAKFHCCTLRLEQFLTVGAQ